MSSNHVALVDCNPRWAARPLEGAPEAYRLLTRDEMLADGTVPFGVAFWCPACNYDHGVCIAFQSYPADGKWAPGGPRWDATPPADCDFGKLTVRPSIRNHGGCTFHGFITDGQVTW